jgi:hypothetical protein
MRSLQYLLAAYAWQEGVQLQISIITIDDSPCPPPAAATVHATSSRTQRCRVTRGVLSVCATRLARRAPTSAGPRHARASSAPPCQVVRAQRTRRQKTPPSRINARSTYHQQLLVTLHSTEACALVHLLRRLVKWMCRAAAKVRTSMRRTEAWFRRTHTYTAGGADTRPRMLRCASACVYLALTQEYGLEAAA